jgi:hypothetical protein
MSDFIVTQVSKQLMTLPDHLQQRVFDFVQALKASARPGVSGQSLLRFAGLIPPDDLNEMRLAIEAGCGQVEAHGW